jgi:23S rRNA pseudouridine1911/1915/1917 synthase
MQRVYTGVVHGMLKRDAGVVNAAIARHPVHRTKYYVAEDGREAETHYRVLERFRVYTHAEFRLVTGRTHQIRVHMANLCHPLAGDRVYAPYDKLTRLKGQCLHAGTLGFIHPISAEALVFHAQPPAPFRNFLRELNI